MPFKVAEEIEEIRAKLDKVVWPLVSDTDNKRWTLKNGSDRATTGLVYRGEHETIGTVWKVEAEIDITPEQFYRRVILAADLAEWCPIVDEYKVIERNKLEDWEVAYSYAARIGPISARDFVNLSYYKMYADGSFQAMSIATEHPEVSKRSHAVRGEYLPSSCYVVPMKDNPKRSVLYWTNNTDMKGYLPRSLVNIAMSGYLRDFAKSLIDRSKALASMEIPVSSSPPAV